MKMSLRPTRCCSRCKGTCQGEFKKVVNLKFSGLLIYVYNNFVSPCARKKQIQSIVIHNTGHKEIKKFDFIIELCQYRTKCYQCQRAIQCIHNLLDDINIIRKNEVLAVCDHCKSSKFKNKCKRCQYLLERFILCSVKRNESRLDAYRSCLCSVKRMLQNLLLSQNVCGNRLCLEHGSDPELNNLINLVKTPSPSTSPAIETLSIRTELEIDSLGAIEKDTKQKLDELIDNLCIGDESPTREEESPCMCRYFMEHKQDFKPKVSLEAPVAPQIPSPPCPSRRTTSVASATKSPGKAGKSGISRKSKEDPSLDDSENAILGMIKKRKKDKVKEKKEKEIKLPEIGDLPVLRRRKKKKVVAHDSESILECVTEEVIPNVMIKGTRIVPFDPHYKTPQVDPHEPILFRRTYNFAIPYEMPTELESPPLDKKTDELHKDTKGIIRYELSNREFIAKGWTKLPIIKIMRRMNIYRMVPASPQYDWFMNHQHERVLLYDTGEILAEIYENGCGKWYYKNGLVALDFYNSEEIHVKQRYIVYGLNDEFRFNTKRPITVLACFDHLGNGIIYDHAGKVRLKYNQSEGVVIDEKIAPHSKWKWHMLNEPPVLFNAYIDNKVEVSEELQHLKEGEQHFEEKIVDDKMIAIELENFVRAKATKMMQKFKPFQIRMKVVKINEYFSLRIIDQANIYILYRVGQVSLKLNIGMHLKSDEIIDTETSEVSEVSTPYDTDISLSKSVCDIQDILSNVKKFYRTRK